MENLRYHSDQHRWVNLASRTNLQQAEKKSQQAGRRFSKKGKKRARQLRRWSGCWMGREAEGAE